MARAPLPRTPRRRTEAGQAMVIALGISFAIAAFITAMLIYARGVEYRSKRTTERATAYPHLQSAVSTYRRALDSGLASTADDYVLDETDLARLGPNPDIAGTYVAKGAELPASFRTTGGVWEHAVTDGALLRKAELPSLAYHQPTNASPATCSELGVDVADCTDVVHGFWQVYRVELPDTVRLDSTGNLTVYLRAWAQAVRAGAPTGPTTAAATIRVELRPGRFADYLMLSDGRIPFETGATINGPVHSNGFDTASLSLSTSSDSISLEAGVTCTGSGSLTSATGTISSAGSGCPVQVGTGRYISFLRAFDELDRLERDVADGRPHVHVFPTDDAASGPAKLTAYHVYPQGTNLRVVAPSGATTTVPVDPTGNGAVLVKDDVVLHGGDVSYRFTIASRKDDGISNVYVTGDVNRNVTGAGRTLGIVSQGDIVVDMPVIPPGGSTETCGVTVIRAALVAGLGSLTLPREIATTQRGLRAPRCSQTLTIDGSIAGHSAPLLYYAWTGTLSAMQEDLGYSQDTGYAHRSYLWDRRLVASPPPYFPLTGRWQAVQVKEANLDCLTGTRIADESCR